MATDSQMMEILLLRKKLEVRTWFLRVSIALNTSFAMGIVVALLTK